MHLKPLGHLSMLFISGLMTGDRIQFVVCLTDLFSIPSEGSSVKHLI